MKIENRIDSYEMVDCEMRWDEMVDNEIVEMVK